MTGPGSALPSVAGLLLLAGTVHAEDCKVAADRTASAPLTGIERIEIEAGAGDLHVNGATGVSTVEARGRACASSEEMLEGIKLEMERRDNVLRVTALSPGRSMLHVFGRSSYATLDLTVKLPASLPVKLIDASGDVEVGGISALDLKDGSGDVLVHDIARDVSIDDDSGDLTVTNVQGNVTLRDTSGNMTVKKVAGIVEVLADGSGDIDVDEIGRGLIVRSDSSGAVNFNRVGGTVQIPARGQ
jgi:Putative adhesin